MRLVVRSIGVGLLAVVAAVLLALTSATSPMYALAAATYILPGAFGYPFTDQGSKDLAITHSAGAGLTLPAPLNVLYFGSAPPSPGGIQPDSVLFGYSQGASDLTSYKQSFNQNWTNGPDVPPGISFVLIGNPGRPNGGFNGRLNLVTTPTATAGAVPGQITTYDIARQYDPVADFPTNPLNLLAVANATVGFVLVHMNYADVDVSQAVLQETYGDTAYYLIPTYPLPLLMPLNVIPVLGPLLTDILDPPLRAIVEAGYDRTVNPGVPTPFAIGSLSDPAAPADGLQLAAPTGLSGSPSDLTTTSMHQPETQTTGPAPNGEPPASPAVPATEVDSSNDGPSTTNATNRTATPSTKLATEPARLTKRAAGGLDRPSVKRPIPSLKVPLLNRTGGEQPTVAGIDGADQRSDSGDTEASGAGGGSADDTAD